jgi:predicted choloylglycine hydrolase
MHTSQTQSLEEKCSIMKTPSDIKVLTIAGTPWERGKVHGKTLKSTILEVIDVWKDNLQKFTEINPNKYVDKFVEETGLITAAKKWSPHLLEEVKGIAEGAQVDFNTIFALQCADEEWWYRKPFEKFAIERCSALGCFKQGDTPALLAQNLDSPNYEDGFQILLHIKHEGSCLESFVFTIAGVIGVNGMNNHPLGICCNTLLDLNHATDGLPVAFIVRAILEQTSLDKAIKFLHEIKHASGQNYIIGDSEKVVDFECSANKVRRFVPYEGASRVYHTNHTLINDDKESKMLPPTANTLNRFNFLESQLKDPSKIITVETIKAILSSHEGPICVHNTHQLKGACTLGSLIMSLSTSPELHLASGPPCSKEYKTFRF